MGCDHPKRTMFDVSLARMRMIACEGCWCRTLSTLSSLAGEAYAYVALFFSPAMPALDAPLVPWPDDRAVWTEDLTQSAR